jgi:hypothetical protein
MGSVPGSSPFGQVEGVPKSRCHPLESAAVGPAAIDTSPLAAAGQRGPVGADQLIGGTEVLAEGEIQIAGAIEGEAGQAVMRIFAWRVEFDDHLAGGGGTVSSVIAEPINLRPRGQEDGTARRQGEAHGVDKAVGEGMNFAESPIGAGVGEDADAVAAGSLVARRTFMSVVLDDPEPAAFIDGQAGGSDDVRLPGEQFDDQPFVGDDRRCGMQGEGCKHQAEDGKQATAHSRSFPKRRYSWRCGLLEVL